MSYYKRMGASTDQGFRARTPACVARRPRVADMEARRQKAVDAARGVAEVIFGTFVLFVLMYGACL